MSQDHNHLNHATWECKYHVHPDAGVVMSAAAISVSMTLQGEELGFDFRRVRSLLSDALRSRAARPWAGPLPDH
jgi:hypothetical protein